MGGGEGRGGRQAWRGKVRGLAASLQGLWEGPGALGSGRETADSAKDRRKDTAVTVWPGGRWKGGAGPSPPPPRTPRAGLLTSSEWKTWQSIL